MQENSVINKIYTRMQGNDSQEVYIVDDFLDLGQYHAVRKGLLRLSESNKIKKVLDGVYYCPKYSELIGEYEAPSIDKVAYALARKYGWNIVPSGNTALNYLGLSFQVPAKYVYVSDGPYREFVLDNLAIKFKHCSNKEITKVSSNTAILIQAIKAIGKDNIADGQINTMKRWLSDNDKKKVLNDSQYTTVWIGNILQRICKGD